MQYKCIAKNKREIDKIKRDVKAFVFNKSELIPATIYGKIKQKIKTINADYQVNVIFEDEQENTRNYVSVYIFPDRSSLIYDSEKSVYYKNYYKLEYRSYRNYIEHRIEKAFKDVYGEKAKFSVKKKGRDFVYTYEYPKSDPK